MPICPHCGQEFQSHIDYATDEEKIQWNENIQRWTQAKTNVKYRLVIVVFFILMLIITLIIRPQHDPYRYGMLSGASLILIINNIESLYKFRKELKRVIPHFEKAGITI
jgi:uncharacterized membrane protein YqjE